jgi:hypothetical protein
MHASANRSEQPPCSPVADHCLSYQFIKQLDPWHMVTSGDEGMQNYANSSVITDYVYNGGSGTSFDEILEMENIDYGKLSQESWKMGKQCKSRKRGRRRETLSAAASATPQGLSDLSFISFSLPRNFPLVPWVLVPRKAR